mmetsp:Transcript_58935/g.86253  ORF Transcript_58935/g.86253 Transcript_58935/m.86253 type:complete len:295 (+) Transcript_58935:171-1055(+)
MYFNKKKKRMNNIITTYHPPAKVQTASATFLQPIKDTFPPYTCSVFLLPLHTTPHHGIIIPVENASHTFCCIILPAASHSRCSEVPLQVGVLARKLQEHGVVEELVDADVLAEPLAAARLDHELARQVRRGAGLQRVQHDRPVQRVPRHRGPVVEGRERHRLALGVGAEVGLEAEGLDGGQEGLDGVEGRPGLGRVLHHVPAPPGEHGVDGLHGVGRGLDLHAQHRLHQPGRGHQEGRVGRAPRRGDHLAPAPVDGLRGDRGVQDLELAVAHRLVAQRPLTATPLEPLDDRLTH